MRSFREESIVGSKFGYLTIIGNGGYSIKKSGARQQMAKVKCDCGTVKEVIYYFLKKGKIKSCGCKKIELVMKGVITHGMSQTPIYKVWSALQKRCNTESDVQFFNYGGRGIKCLRESFEDFYRDMGPSYQRGLSIDRINNNGDYCKENCRWITQKEQCLNKRTNHTITIDGVTKKLCEWSNESGIPFNTIIHRLQRGYSERDAVFTKPNAKYVKKEKN